jgi:membrane-associated protein
VKEQKCGLRSNDKARFLKWSTTFNILAALDIMWEFLKELTDPQSIIREGGMILLLLVIFAENGLIVGFFLPGDSLIFLAGVITASANPLNTEIEHLALLMFMAAAAGSLFGYLFGRRVGKSLFQRPDSFLFKKKYLDMTQVYYEKHGGKTLILGRFLPIIRTFAPIVAGVIRVPFGTFMIFNLIGAALWIGSLSFLGYFIGHRFPWIESYLGYIIIGFILVTTSILIRQYWKHTQEQKKKS